MSVVSLNWVLALLVVQVLLVVALATVLYVEWLAPNRRWWLLAFAAAGLVLMVRNVWRLLGWLAVL